MVVNERPLKRMKRRITADLNDFFTFPSANNSHVDVGPFRSSVRDFISKHALLPPPSSLFPHLMTWQILFRVGDDAGDDAAAHAFSSSTAAVCLDIVEEDVARSRSVYCDHCRVVGWSGHPVCGKRYHFIIKADGNSIGGYHKPCMCCGDVVHIYETKCKSCNLDASTNDVEDWVYNQLENTTHLLHGVVHSNGFGHLLRVNGREGGSRLLSGCHIMDFWDRLCKLLGVRMVSVMDVSKKYGLEYRLLHSIIKGHPWYGDWGYEFAAGSFALTRDAYKLAVETLSSLPLSIFLSQGRNPGSRIHDIILRYKSLSECELETTRDLFGFLISLVHDAHKSSSSLDDSMSKKQPASTSGVLCAWTKSDIECVEEAMFKVLRAVTGSNWVSGRNLRRAVYKVAPPELLDYCLRELGGKMAADGMLVCSRYNPGTETFEYRLEAGGVSSKGSTACTGSSISSSLSEETLLLDMRYLYESMLQPQTIVKSVPQVKRDLAISSAEKLLDCKQFVKDYKPEKMSTNDPSVIRVLCGVEFTDESEEYTPISPPPELIVLSNATVSDLKLAASKAFQDVYLILKRFQAEELLDYGGVDESTQVRQLGSAEFVRVRGRCNAKNAWSKFRMERGIEGWTVDCSCGAKDDDGERMLACDVCGVWQHTRCLGIPDSDSVPAKFVCDGCKSSVGFVAKAGGPCKDEVVANVAGDSCCFGNSFDCPS